MKEGTGISNVINVFTTPQGPFQKRKCISNMHYASSCKTITSLPVHQFELQSWAQFVRFVPENMWCHTQGSCPLFVLTLTSSDPEAPRKYSLAIFSNPHIHSLWLCWETHSVRAPSNLNQFIWRTFVSQLQAYGAVFQSPSSHELSSSLTAVVQLLLYTADSQWAAIQEHRATRQTQFTGAWKH